MNINSLLYTAHCTQFSMQCTTRTLHTQHSIVCILHNEYTIGWVGVMVDRVYFGHRGVVLDKYGKIINNDAQFHLQCLAGVCNCKPINFPQ